MEKESRKAKVLFLRARVCEPKTFALMMIISTYLVFESKYTNENYELDGLNILQTLSSSIATNVSTSIETFIIFHINVVSS